LTTNDSAVAAAVSGFGLTRLMSYLVAEHLRAGRLKIVLSEFEAAALPVQLVHREGRHASQKARAFLDLAIERLRGRSVLELSCSAWRRHSPPSGLSSSTRKPISSD